MTHNTWAELRRRDRRMFIWGLVAGVILACMGYIVVTRL